MVLVRACVVGQQGAMMDVVLRRGGVPELKPGTRTSGNMRTEKISCQKESKLLTTKMSILGCAMLL